MCWLFSSGRPRLLKQFDIRRYLNLNSDLFSLHHGFSISDHQHINFNIDYQQLLSDKASPTDLIWFSLITGTRRELICFNLCVFKCLLKWSVWDDEHWLHLFYFSAPCLIKYYQMPLRPELPLRLSSCESDSRTNDLLWLPKNTKINSTIGIVVDNPQWWQRRRQTTSDFWQRLLKGWPQFGTIVSGKLLFIVQGVFFNWNPPKKLKYGKPRLGESTAT